MEARIQIQISFCEGQFMKNDSQPLHTTLVNV